MGILPVYAQFVVVKSLGVNMKNQISFRKALSDSLPNPTYVVNWQGNVISHNSAFETSHCGLLQKCNVHLENGKLPFKDVFSNAHEVTAETKENRTIYTQVFEIDNVVERCINHWHTLCNLPASNDAVSVLVGKILPRRVI